MGYQIRSGGYQDQRQRLREDLAQWWRETAEREIDGVVDKAIEYGATDLAEIGRTLNQAMKRPGATEAQMAELGVFFYITGKMARWADAVKDGRNVSDDTLHDIGVYVRMAQRIRTHGGWPGQISPWEIEEGQR